MQINLLFLKKSGYNVIPKTININGVEIGGNNPCYIIAEMSCNHHQDFDTAVQIIQQSAKAGADAVKVQLYKPETMTLKGGDVIPNGLWHGKTPYELYESTCMPWEWYEELIAVAKEANITIFPTVYDYDSLEFAMKYNPPALKVSSFEAIWFDFIEEVSKTGKPTIVSTGKCSNYDIDSIGECFGGSSNLALLLCSSNYPANDADNKIAMIPQYKQAYQLPVGFSDHSLCGRLLNTHNIRGHIWERHVMLDGDRDNCADAMFSSTMSELYSCIESICRIENTPDYDFSRSLWAVNDIKKGDVIEPFGAKNIAVKRPGLGLHPNAIYNMAYKKASRDIKAGEPITLEMIE